MNAEIGGFGTHVLRHAYRSWLDAVSTPIDVVTDEMQETHAKVVGMALAKAN